MSNKIPRWATWTFATSNVLAILGLVGFFSISVHGLLLTAFGLVMAAVALKSAEQVHTDN